MSLYIFFWYSDSIRKRPSDYKDIGYLFSPKQG